MRILLHTNRVEGGVLQREGDVVEVPDAEARRLIAARSADPADPVATKVKGKNHNEKRS